MNEEKKCCGMCSYWDAESAMGIGQKTPVGFCTVPTPAWVLEMSVVTSDDWLTKENDGAMCKTYSPKQQESKQG